MAGIHLWSTGANGGITDTSFYANAIYMAQSPHGNPAGVDCMSNGIRNIRFYNNCFQTDGKAAFVRGETNRGVLFEGNTFDADCGFRNFLSAIGARPILLKPRKKGIQKRLGSDLNTHLRVWIDRLAFLS